MLGALRTPRLKSGLWGLIILLADGEPWFGAEAEKFCECPEP